MAPVVPGDRSRGRLPLPRAGPILIENDTQTIVNTNFADLHHQFDSTDLTSQNVSRIVLEKFYNYVGVSTCCHFPNENEEMLTRLSTEFQKDFTYICSISFLCFNIMKYLESAKTGRYASASRHLVSRACDRAALARSDTTICIQLLSAVSCTCAASEEPWPCFSSCDNNAEALHVWRSVQTASAKCCTWRNASSADVLT